MNRNFPKAQQLAQKFGATAVEMNLSSPLLNSADMVINATSVDLQNDVTPFMQKDSLYLGYGN